MAILLLAACAPPATRGPARIAWDRDTCERCGMTISDRRFAAQIRFAGDRVAHAFDDLGCALLWLDGPAEGGSAPPEIWVRDAAGERWIAADSARFAGGFRTPMGYGFATAPPSEDGLRLAEVRARVRAGEDERRSPDR